MQSKDHQKVNKIVLSVPIYIVVEVMDNGYQTGRVWKMRGSNHIETKNHQKKWAGEEKHIIYC